MFQFIPLQESRCNRKFKIQWSSDNDKAGLAVLAGPGLIHVTHEVTQGTSLNF
jgi:hypothetical protein